MTQTRMNRSDRVHDLITGESILEFDLSFVGTGVAFGS